MIIALLFAVAVWRGATIARLPSLRAGRAPAIDPAQFLDGVTSELRRGASLRTALALAAPDSRMARLAVSGQPMVEVAAAVESLLGDTDDLVQAGTLLAAASGAPAAALFAGLADRQRRRRQKDRDLAAATAQARLSAGVIAAIPLLVGVGAVVAGGAASLTDSSPKRFAVGLGATLQLAGIAALVLLLRGSR